MASFCWTHLGLAASYSLITTANVFQSGQSITVNWSSTSGNAKDWIGWYRTGDPNSAFGPWRYTNGASSGSFTISAPTTPGTYEFRYLLNDGFTEATRSLPVTVGTNTVYSLTVSSTSVQAGQSVTVNWSSPSGSAKDWIGWYRTGDPNSGFGAWRYTNGAGSGSFTITVPGTSGTYEFRYLLNDGYAVAVRSETVTVQGNSTASNSSTTGSSTASNGSNSQTASVLIASNSTYSLVAAATTIQAGQSVTANWTSPSGNSKDWVGWFRSADSNNNFGPWRYTNGASSGSFAVTAPSTAGTYEFRYLLNDGFNAATRSQIVTVVANTGSTANSSSGPTVPVNSATSASAPVMSLSFDGSLRDRVGQASLARSADGKLDGTFTVTYTSGGTRTLTQLKLTNNIGGVWDTAGSTVFWTLGTATGLDAALLNGSDDAVNFTVNNGDSFKVFAADFNNIEFVVGRTFTLVASFSDGTSATSVASVAVVTAASSNAAQGGNSGQNTANVNSGNSNSASGPAYYVATNGNDNNPGTLAQPFRTLQRAIPSLKPGDTLYVRGGEYDTVDGLFGNNGRSIIPSGLSWDQPVTIKAYPGETPVFRRYLPAGYDETVERTKIYMPTPEQCNAMGWTQNYPWGCWSGGGFNGNQGDVRIDGAFVQGYVLMLRNGLANPVQYVIFDGIVFDAAGITLGAVTLGEGSVHIKFQNFEIKNSIQSCVSQPSTDESAGDKDLWFIDGKVHHCGAPYWVAGTAGAHGSVDRTHPAHRFHQSFYMHSGGVVWDGVEVSDVGGAGVSPLGPNNIIRNSYFHNNTAMGIICAGNWLFENNVVVTSGSAEGAKTYGCRFNHNTFMGINGAKYGIFIDQNAPGPDIIENNIIVGYDYGVISNQTDRFGVSHPVAQNNLIVANQPGQEIRENGTSVTSIIRSSNILGQDPKFVNPAAGDFRLKGGSPAIGKATDGGDLGVQ